MTLFFCQNLKGKSSHYAYVPQSMLFECLFRAYQNFDIPDTYNHTIYLLNYF